LNYHGCIINLYGIIDCFSANFTMSRRCQEQQICICSWCKCTVTQSAKMGRLQVRGYYWGLGMRVHKVQCAQNVLMLSVFLLASASAPCLAHDASCSFSVRPYFKTTSQLVLVSLPRDDLQDAAGTGRRYLRQAGNEAPSSSPSASLAAARRPSIWFNHYNILKLAMLPMKKLLLDNLKQTCPSQLCPDHLVTTRWESEDIQLCRAVLHQNRAWNFTGRFSWI
jgi:hypothetical protein